MTIGIQLFFFLLCVFISFLVNWLFLRFSRGLGARNTEFTQERWSAEVKPAVGGFSFFILFLIGAAVMNLLPGESTGATSIDRRLIGILGASTLGFLLGLADDTYNTNPLVKFIGQLSCAFILIVSDVSITATGIEEVDFIVTTLWVIGLMNSINMLDNMDAITASTSVMIILATAAFAFVQGVGGGVVVLLMAVLGALIGFLFFNWNPARMYMGDTGSQFLGVFLAAVSILLLWGERDTTSGMIQVQQFVVPALVFIMPLVDTLTVTIRRLARKQSPFVGGRDHTTHHLVYFGLNERQTALVFIVVSLISSGLAVALKAGVIPWTSTFTLLAVVYFILVFFGFQVIYNIGLRKNEAARG